MKLKKGRIAALTALLFLASPKAKANNLTLVLPFSENNVQYIHGFSGKGASNSSYNFSFFSATKRSDDIIVAWGAGMNVNTNIENYMEIFQNLENDCKTVISSYDSLKIGIPLLVSKIDGLEAKLNDVSFNEKAENAKTFFEEWKSSLPSGLNYYDKEHIEQFANFINDSDGIKGAYDSFKEVSRFITEAKDTIMDEEIKNLAYSADETRANLENNWEKMSGATDRIYQRVIYKNLNPPYAGTSFNVFIKLLFPFYGKWLM